MWSDLFEAPSATEMASQGVKGVAPPKSAFVANRQLFSETSLSFLLQRLRGASTGSGHVTGRHGTGIVSVKAMPGSHTHNQGGLDIFVIELGAAGQVLRTVQLGSPENDHATAVAADRSCELRAVQHRRRGEE